MPGYPISTVSDIGPLFEYNEGLHTLPDTAGDTLAAVEGAPIARRAAEVRVLELAGHWATLHPKESLFPGASAVPGAERAGQLGGEGTPLVAEFAPAELAVSLEVHPHAARSMIADVLDLQHRLELLWSTVVDLRLEPWLARKVARLTRSVTLAQAREIDERLAEVAATLPPARLIALTEALVIACDTAGEDARRAAALASRFATFNQSTEHGTKGLYAKLDVADAIRLDATIDRLARALPAADATLDVRRSQALGLLAHPAAAARLLDGDAAGAGPPPLSPNQHQTQSDITPAAHGGARVEATQGSAPITLAHAREILGHSRVTIKPVIDLAHALPADAYEFTGTLREAVFLRSPADSFPHAVNLSRRMQIDHTLPHGAGGPTALANAAPLGQRHHRIATHGRWRRRQPRSGLVVWQTPHGRYRATNHTGTHTVGATLGRALFNDTSTTETHLAEVLLEQDFVRRTRLPTLGPSDREA